MSTLNELETKSFDSSPRRYWPLCQLVAARVREFYREPEAIFWVYGFPILMVLALGFAFRNKPVEQIRVDVEAGKGAETAYEALQGNEKFIAEIHDAQACRVRLRTGKTDLVVLVTDSSKPEYQYLFDPTRPES